MSFENLEKASKRIKFHAKGHRKPDVNGKMAIKGSFISYGDFSIYLQNLKQNFFLFSRPSYCFQ